MVSALKNQRQLASGAIPQQGLTTISRIHLKQDIANGVKKCYFWEVLTSIPKLTFYGPYSL